MANSYNIEIDQGSYVELTLTYYTDSTQTVVIPMNGYNFKMQIRKNKEDISFLDELTDSNSRIDVTNAATGIIKLKFPTADTLKYDFQKAYYDLYSINTATPTLQNRDFEGFVKVNRSVTR